MKRKVIFFMFCLFGAAFLLSGCAVPRALWPQKDLSSSESPGKTDGHVVLVASRNSEFKMALVRKLHDAMVSMGVAQRMIGIGDLKHINAAEYDAVVVISTCLAWGLDRDVQLFLKRQDKNANIILVTTSAAGDWLPDIPNSDIDALSSASNMTTVEAVARDVMEQISVRMHDKKRTSAN